MIARTVILSVRSVLQSPGLYSIWMSGSNGRSVGTKVMPKSRERNSRNPPTSDTSPVSITWNQTQRRALREQGTFKMHNHRVELHELLCYEAKTCTFMVTIRFFSPQTPHLSRVVRADGNAELSLDEGVVDQVSHIFKRLPVVFTDTVTETCS